MAKGTDLRILQRNATLPRVAALIIDGHSRSEIAKTCEISERTLITWLKTPEFQAIWDEMLSANTAHFSDAALSTIQAMLPEAIRQQARLLSSSDTPASVRWQVIQDIRKMAGVEDTQQDSREELRKFLRDVNVVQINQTVQVDGVLPDGYLEALREIMPPTADDEDVIDTTAVTVLE